MEWLVIVAILAAIVGGGALIASLRHKKGDLTLDEVARYIEDFVAGKGKPYDWDDFTSWARGGGGHPAATASRATTLGVPVAVR